MTDAQMRKHFGLSERALQRLRNANNFPKRDELIGKTDSKAVDRYFDGRAGLLPPARIAYEDGQEKFD